jgi:hypothetical protein
MKDKDLIEQLRERCATSMYCRGQRKLAADRLEKYMVLEEAMPELLQLVEDLMPGIGGLALQNYARVNDAPLAVRKALAALEE